MNNKTHKPEYIARYREGAKAKRDGLSEYENKYPTLTMANVAWLAGYRECTR